MLDKNEIINGLKNRDYLVRNAIFENIVNLCLYDDKEIQDAFIEFLKDNFRKIDLDILIFSKLSKEIIQCLLEIFLNKDNSDVHEDIEYILMRHYKIIKDFDYNFEELFKDEEDVLLYKKIKHFSKKDRKTLYDLYVKSVQKFIEQGDETNVDGILRIAIGNALLQFEDGENAFEAMTYKLLEIRKNETGEYEDFFEDYMPWLMGIIQQTYNIEFYKLVMQFYFFTGDFYYSCLHYLSSIQNEEVIDNYLSRMKKFPKAIIKTYYFDMAQYFNSEEVDNFLLRQLKADWDNSIKENIIRILANKLDKRVIPFANSYVQNGNFEDEESLKISLAPLLILNKCDDITSKKIIQDAKELLVGEEKIEELSRGFVKVISKILHEDNEDIKEYKKIRKLHNDIVGNMMQDYIQDKVSIEIGENINDLDIESRFKLQTYDGFEGMANIIAYKNHPEISCVTEKYIKNKKYRKKEKIKLLNCMLNSEVGLFEITNVNLLEAKVYLKDIFNNKEYCITDMALSTNPKYDHFYLYTRIITYDDICFKTGLSLIYKKDNKFIEKWIKDARKNHENQPEIVRFMELYNYYENNDEEIKFIKGYF